MSTVATDRPALIRDRLDLDLLRQVDKSGELVELARHASAVTPSQIELFKALFERQSDAPPSDKTVAAFSQLPRRQAAALLDVMLGRTTLEEASAEEVTPESVAV